MATQTVTKPSLTIKRRLNAPPGKVFAAWADPEKVKGWMAREKSKYSKSSAIRVSADATGG